MSKFDDSLNEILDKNIGFIEIDGVKTLYADKVKTVAEIKKLIVGEFNKSFLETVHETDGVPDINALGLKFKDKIEID